MVKFFKLREQNEELRSEIERLNKCLSAKDELERNQIEVVSITAALSI